MRKDVAMHTLVMTWPTFITGGKPNNFLNIDKVSIC